MQVSRSLTESHNKNLLQRVLRCAHKLSAGGGLCAVFKSNANAYLHGKNLVFKNKKVVWALVAGVGLHSGLTGASRITTAAIFAVCPWAEFFGGMPQRCFKSNANVYGKRVVFKKVRWTFTARASFHLV